MAVIDFDQTAFVEKIFAFLGEYEITVRDFSERARISPGSLYKAGRKKNPPEMKISTINHLNEVMERYKREAFL